MYSKDTSFSFRALMGGALFIAMILVGCDSEAMQTPDPSPRQDQLSDAIQVGGFNHDDLSGDPFELKNARFDGTDLVIDVAYSGGCAKHGWKLYADEAVALSMPPQLGVYMVHDGAGDDCEAYPSETIRVDASALFDWFQTAFIVHLQGINSSSDKVTVEWSAE